MVRSSVRDLVAEIVLLPRYGSHAHLHSFPTRRSSDLSWNWNRAPLRLKATHSAMVRPKTTSETSRASSLASCWPCWSRSRSEEHTSELQSQFHLVCRLLLEKKNDWTSGRSR